MDSSTKNMLVLGGAAIAGGWGGSWATGRLGTALGLSLGPWGAIGGAVIGAMIGTAMAKSMLASDTPMLPETDSLAIDTGEEEAKSA